MCDGFDDEDAEENGIGIGRLPAASLDRIRVIEADLPGEAVPEEAWDIFAGIRSGAIDWRDYQRIRHCFTLASSRALMPNKRRDVSFRSITCDAGR